MLDPYVRNILFYDLLLLHTPNNGSIVPLADVINHIKDRVDREESKKLIQNGTEQISIRKLEIDSDQRIAFLLLNYGNSRVTDPAFIHMDNGVIRVAQKQDREGVAVSAHMALSLERTGRDQIRYKALLEDVPGIGKTKIAPFLNTEIANATDYSFRDKDGVHKKIRLTPDLQVHQGQMLREAFQRGGVLTGIELVSYRRDSEWDDDGLLKEEKASVMLKVERQNDEGMIRRALDKLKGVGSDRGYSEMRLIWKEPSATGRERQRSARVGLAREDAMDAIFGRQEEIRTQQAQPQCRDSLCDEVCRELRRIMNS